MESSHLRFVLAAHRASRPCPPSSSVSVSASASYRRSQTPSARGTLGSRGPHRSHVAGSSAYFRIVSIEMPGPLVPAGKPATLGNAAPQLLARRGVGGTHAWSMYVRITSDAPRKSQGDRNAKIPVQDYEVSTILFRIQCACWLHGVGESQQTTSLSRPVSKGQRRAPKIDTLCAGRQWHFEVC